MAKKKGRFKRFVTEDHRYVDWLVAFKPAAYLLEFFEILVPA